ncbi:MAG: hypothetical protein JNK82_32935 [Myxococcaceae bacterium]|nr:hypothetical protein [Myxococcaceae bacterium]
MSPVVAALLFHAPGVMFLTKHRLSTRARWLNAAAVAVTLALIAVAFFARGFTAAFVTWLVAHAAWSVVLALLVKRELA